MTTSRKCFLAALVLGTLVAVVPAAQAQTRLAAFALNCDGAVYARINFTVALTHTTYFFTNSCYGGTGLRYPLPTIPDSAGNVVKLTVTVDTRNPSGAHNVCDFTAQNGFVNGTCMVDTRANGPIDAAHVLVSIPN